MYLSISIDEFQQRIKKEKLSVIDVREVDEYQMGHLPGTINIPLSSWRKTRPTLDKKSVHYVICQSGFRSAKVCEWLSMQEYQVVNVIGGISAWRGTLI